MYFSRVIKIELHTDRPGFLSGLFYFFTLIQATMIEPTK